MYRVIIVDDEQLIREGLKVLIDWTDLGFEIIDEADNGIDAQQLVMAVQPEVILVDIKMPGLDGISLIKALRQQGYAGEVIILTGYAEFEYAKEAISLEVIDYLIKPIEEEELIQVLEKAKSKLDDEMTLKYMLDNQKINLEKNHLRNRLFSNTQSEAEVTLGNDAFYTESDNYHVVILSLSDDLDVEQEQAIVAFLIDLKQARFLKYEDKYIVVTKNKSLKQLQIALGNFIIKHDDIEIFITVGRQVKGEYLLRKSYLDAKNLSAKGFLYRDQNPVFWDEYDVEVPSDTLVFDATYLYDLVEVGNDNAIKVYFSQMEEQMIYSDNDVDKIKGICVNCFITAKERLIFNYGQVELILPDNNVIIDHIYSAESLHDIIVYMEACFLEASAAVCDGSTDNMIKRILNYIHNNYYRSLRLEFLARLFNYNSSYLGILFKEKTGDNFNLYLDKVRIEHAKTLIETGGYKVYEVAEKVGYSSVDYFYTKFKKHVGLSPNAYKKRDHH